MPSPNELDIAIASWLVQRIPEVGAYTALKELGAAQDRALRAHGFGRGFGTDDVGGRVLTQDPIATRNSWRT